LSKLQKTYQWIAAYIYIPHKPERAITPGEPKKHAPLLIIQIVLVVNLKTYG